MKFYEFRSNFWQFITDIILPISALLFFITGIIGFLTWVIKNLK
jgi:hypothetical protein